MKTNYALKQYEKTHPASYKSARDRFSTDGLRGAFGKKPDSKIIKIKWNPGEGSAPTPTNSGRYIAGMKYVVFTDGSLRRAEQKPYSAKRRSAK